MAWLDPAWLNREKITIPKELSDSNLPDQVVILGISAYGAMSNAKANGFDFRTTQDDGATLIKHERRTWSGGGGGAVTATFAIKADPLAAADVDIYIYWGNAGASDGADPTNVYDVNFKGVWPLDSDFNDSTVNGNDLTPSGGGITFVPGIVGNGAEFDDALSEFASRDSAPATMPSTYEAWGYKHDNSSIGILVCIVDKDVTQHYQHIATLDNANGQNCWAGLSSGAEKDAKTSNTYSVNTWHYCVGTFANSTLREAYLDADIANKGTNVDLQSPVGQDRIAIGGLIVSVPAAFFDGVLDEVRISNSVRSESYINFVHLNITEAQNGLVWGGVETEELEIEVGSGAFIVTGQIATLTLSQIVVYSNMKAHLDRNLSAEAHLDRDLNAKARIDDN